MPATTATALRQVARELVGRHVPVPDECVPRGSRPFFDREEGW